MTEEIYEIKIVSVDSMPKAIQEKVNKDAKGRGNSFNFKGFAKVTYVTNSPKSIKSIEPISGTIVDYYETISNSKKISIPVF